MCNVNPAFQSLVREHVATLVANGAESFTAHDVTRSLRRVSPGVSVPHDDVRATLLHANNHGEMPGWATTLVPLPNGQKGPIVYFKISARKDNLQRKIAGIIRAMTSGSQTPALEQGEAA